MQTSRFFPRTSYSLILKVVGIILILGTLVDSIMLAVPPNFGNSEWTAALIGQWIARGTVPLLGLAILSLGLWFESNPSEISETTGQSKGWPKLAFFLSAFLGILFLVLAPLYFSSTGLSSKAQTDEVNQQAEQAEKQLNQTLEQQRAQVSAILSNEDQLTQLQQQIEGINDSSLSEDQKTQLNQVKSTLEKVKSDPKALDQEVAKARTQGIEQIQQKQAEAISKIQTDVQYDRLHKIVTSLLFAIGYLAIAWTGLRRLNRPV